MLGPVFLTGMMASGKTSVGRVLADETRATFVDLDVRIERLFGASVEQLFERGEPHFRSCERTALVSLVTEPAFAARRVVVATGGGVVIDPRNRRAMAAVGTLVLLEVRVEELARRLRHDDEAGARPLLQTHGEDLAARLQALWRERESAYRDGSIAIDAEAAVDDVVPRILAALPQEASPPCR